MRWPKCLPTSYPTLSPTTAARITTAIADQRLTMPREAATPASTARVSPGNTKPTNSASSENTARPVTSRTSQPGALSSWSTTAVTVRVSSSSVGDEHARRRAVGAILQRQPCEAGCDDQCEGQAHHLIAPAEAAYGRGLPGPVGDRGAQRPGEHVRDPEGGGRVPAEPPVAGRGDADRRRKQDYRPR